VRFLLGVDEQREVSSRLDVTFDGFQGKKKADMFFFHEYDPTKRDKRVT